MDQNIAIRLNFEEGPGPLRTIQQLKQVNEEAAKIGKTAEAGFTEMTEAAQAAEKQVLNTASGIEKEAVAAGRAKLQNDSLTKSFLGAAKGVSIFGVNIGDTVDKVQGTVSGLKELKGGLNTSVKGFKLLKLAIAGTGIGLLVIALAGLISFFQRTQRGVDLLDRALAGISATVSVVIDRFSQIGGAIVGLANGTLSLSEALGQTKDAFTGVGEEIRKEVAAIDALTLAKQRLRDAEIDQIENNARLQITIEQSRNIAEDETKSFGEREKASKSALKAQNELFANRIALARENARIIKEENALSESSADDRRTEAEAQADVLRLEAELASSVREDQAKLRDIRKQAGEAAAAAAQKQRDLVDAYNEEVEKLRDRTSAINLSILKEKEALAVGEEKLQLTKEIIEVEKQQALQELDALEALARERAKAANIQFNQDQQFLDLRQKVTEQYNRQAVLAEIEFNGEKLQAQIDAEQELRERLDADRERQRQLDQKDVDDFEKVELAKIELLEKSGNEQLTLEQFKEQERLKIQVEALRRSRQLILDEFGANSPEVQLLDLDIAKLQQQINQIDKINLSPLERIKSKILGALNLSDQEAQIIGDQIANLYASITESITANTDLQIEQQQRVLDKYDENIAELEDRLQEELRLQEDGFANSADIAQEDVEREKELRKKAAEDLQKIKQDSLKRELALDLAAQTSNLIVAISNIIKESSKLGLAGILTAGIGIASLIASFSAGKKAIKAAAEVPELRQGGYLDDNGLLVGPSHENGGIGILYQNRLVEAEGGEQVMSRKVVDKYGNILDAMNAGTFQYFRPSFGEPAPGISPLLRKTIAAQSQLRAAEEDRAFTQMQTAQKNVMESYLAQIAQNTHDTRRAIEEKPVIEKLSDNRILIREKEGSKKLNMIINLK